MKPVIRKNNHYAPIELIIDHRESNRDIREIIKKESWINQEIGRLNCGDYLINNSLLIERKTIPDFIASIKDGRIFHQAAKISNSHKLSLMIIEGPSRSMIFSDFKREVLNGINNYWFCRGYLELDLQGVFN